jgi:hypothetical protein
MRMINVQKWEIMHLRILVHGEVGKLQLMFLVGYAFGKAYELTHSAILCLLWCFCIAGILVPFVRVLGCNLQRCKPEKHRLDCLYSDWVAIPEQHD